MERVVSIVSSMQSRLPTRGGHLTQSTLYLNLALIKFSITANLIELITGVQCRNSFHFVVEILKIVLAVNFLAISVGEHAEHWMLVIFQSCMLFRV